MAVSFDDAVKIILEKEGTLSDNKFDDGGLTKFGISQKSYPDLNIYNLTKEDAIRLYRRDYWDHLRISEMPPLLRLMVFDSAVNHGTFLTTKILQIVTGSKVDGLLGPKTLDLLNTKNPSETLQKLVAARQEIYVKHKDFAVFGQGWLSRLTSITVQSLKENLA